MAAKISKTIDILGLGKKPPSQYELKGEEKTYHELAMRAFDKNKNKPSKMAVDCSEKGVAPFGDRGFLSAVVFSYNKHYILQTTPEDWWFTVINKIAVSIKKLTVLESTDSDDSDDGSPESGVGEMLREFFVSHEGKKRLTVRVPPLPLEQQDFSRLFHQFSEQIQENIKVPEFAEVIRADFSTSTPTHVIESEITLMSSLQNFFEYRMCCMCGIPQIEMMGTEADWRKLKEKFTDLRRILAPIESCFDYFHNWFDKVEEIFDKLIDTYVGKPDIDWWSHIFNKQDAWGSGAPPRYLLGWFITDFLYCRNAEELEDLPTGLNTTPMILEGEGYPVPVNTTIVTGISGIQVEDSLEVPKVKALHGWAIFYDETDAPVERENRREEYFARANREAMLWDEYTEQWEEKRPRGRG